MRARPSANGERARCHFSPSSPATCSARSSRARLSAALIRHAKAAGCMQLSSARSAPLPCPRNVHFEQPAQSAF
eukprot:265604-Pleurochrysis_carterae.AAC.2